MEDKIIYNHLQIKDTNQNITFELWDKNFFVEHKSSKKILEELFKLDFVIWLGIDGDIYYTFPYSRTCKVNTTSTHKLVFIISSLLRREIKISYSLKEISEEQDNILFVSDLPFVIEEKFTPSKFEVFYRERSSDRGVIKNTFKFKEYIFYKEVLCLEFFPKSLQYIFYIAGYDINKFKFIFNWLAALFHGAYNEPPLVLVGNKNSGKEIFYNDIILEIFGEEYCLEVNDELFKNKDYRIRFKNKLVYNFNNLSADALKDKKILKFIENFINNRKEHSGQILLTLDNPYTPFNINIDVCLVEIQDRIENMIDFKAHRKIKQGAGFLPFVSDFNFTSNKLSDIHNLINSIRTKSSDLLAILNNYYFNQDLMDVCKCIKFDKKQSIADQISNFADAVIDKNIEFFNQVEKVDNSLFLEVKNDFEHNVIKQKNLIKLFDILYKNTQISSNARGLMARLRKYKNDIFSTKNINSKSGGIKYFRL